MRHPMDAVFLLALLSAFCIGLSKAGFSGVSLISVFLLADHYGAKASIGLALPLLIAADLLAYPAFRSHGSWKPVWSLLFPTLIGLGIGWWLLGKLPDDLARRSIGGCILTMIAVHLIRSARPGWLGSWLDSHHFGFLTGVVGGFATMLANAAGPVIQLYLTAKKVPKMELIGIGARFFLLINLLKVPLNAQLNLITVESLWLDLNLLPAVALGVFGGRYLIKHVSQSLFEWMVIVFALVAALRLLIW